MMKKRMLTIFLICMALFVVVPLATASASGNVTSGQGTLTLHATFTASSAIDVWITNQNGQTVYSSAFGQSSGVVNVSVPSLPNGTYTAHFAGASLSYTITQFSF